MRRAFSPVCRGLSAPDTIMLKLSKSDADACRWISAAAKEAGGRAYLVGGCVRDSLLGKPPKDIDIEIYGLTPAMVEKTLSRRFRFEMVGKSFGVWILKGFCIDVSVPRTERKTGEGHRAFDVECDPFLSVEAACARRDFTINSMLCDCLTGEIVDPYGGRADLERGILRHTSDKFAEDPLRVLRAMQFIARFGLSPAPETVELCSNIPFENLAPERVFEEWKKLLLKGSEISGGLNFLRDCGWIKYFPELAACAGCPQDPEWHPEGDVFVHTGFCLDHFAAHRTGDDREDLVVGLAVLCHDFGKPLCTAFGEDSKIHSYGHDVLGARPAREFLGRMTREKSLVEEVVVLVERHMAVLDLWRSGAGDSAIRRLARKVGRIDRLVRVDDADRNGRPPLEPGDSPQGVWISERARELSVRDSAPKPILMGRHLVSRGMGPSEKFKAILSAAYEAQLDGEFSDEAGALEWLGIFLREHGA